MTREHRKRLLVILLLAGFLITTVTGQSERLFGLIGLDSLSEANNAYLESSSLRSIGMFGILSTLKVGLAIVEGTEVGIGFGLQIGDIVQAAYDYVDIAWKTVLAGTIILLGTKYLLQAAALFDQWVLAIAVALGLIMYLLTLIAPARYRLRRILNDLIVFTTLLAVALYLVLPLSVAGGALLSRKITAAPVSKAEQGIAGVKNSLFPDMKFSSEHSSIKDKVKYIVTYIKERSAQIASWMFGIIAGYIFDCLIFPFSLFVLILWLTKATARYLFGIQQQRSLREDLEHLLRTYLAPGTRSAISGDSPDREKQEP